MPVKNICNTLFVIFALCLTALKAEAQYPVWNDPNSLPIWMTPEEESRKHEIGQNFLKSAAIAGKMRNVAEFERMEGVLVRYPLGLPVSLIAQFSQQTVVYTLVSNSSNENSARNAYQSAGANMINIKFITASTDSYWTRDYGPWYVVNESNEMGIVDFPYNRPRPLDDAVPGILSTYFSVPMYSMPVIHTGGNYMTDGWGISASSNLVYEENSNNSTWVNQQMNDYLGISTYHVTIDPLGGIKHIDCWAKFLDVDKILITKVPTSNSSYAKYEQMATYYAGQTSSYGTPFQVIRVNSPSGEPYTNSLILNDKVYVPIMSSNPSSTDNAALEVYRQAMPGYTVVGIYYNGWLTSDALHCRAMGLADRKMLYIKHLPLSGSYNYQSGFDITADIVPLSGQTLKSDSLFVIYKTNVRDWDTINFVNMTGSTFNAVIPVNPGETQVNYYLYAVDNAGRREHHPFIGKPDPHTFTIIYNGLAVNPTAVPSQICSGNSTLLNANAVGGSGSYTYSWTSNPAGFSSGQANPSASPAVTTIYTVQVNDGSKTVSGNVTVTVNPLPTAVLSGGGTICPGGSANLLVALTGTQPWSITYTDGTTPVTINNLTVSPATISVSPAITKSYTLTAVSDSKCTGTSFAGSAQVTVNPLPTAVLSGGGTICPGGSANLLVALTGTQPWSITYTDGTTPVTINNLTVSPATISVSPAITKSYTLTAVSDSKCTGTSFTGSALVTVNALPVLYAGADRSIPYGTSVTINDATASGAGSLVYSWTPAASFVNPAVLKPATVALTATNSYTLTVTDGNGCTNSDQLTILVESQNLPPVLDFIGNRTVRQFIPLTFTATATDPDQATEFTFSLVGAPAGATLNPASGLFSWTPSETQGPGTYRFTIRVCDNGTPVLCDEEEITVTVSESPSVSGQVLHDTDRMSDGQVDGAGTNAGGGLYANLLGTGNTVVASVEVASGGTFAFADVTAGSYVVQITKNQGIPGAQKPATELPANWIYTGEHLGTGPGDDGTPDGMLAVVADGNTDVADARFGIVKLPDIAASLTVSPNVMAGVTPFNVFVKITELNQVRTDGVITVLIPRDIRWNLQGDYNPALTMLGSVALKNGDWNYNAENPDYHIFLTSVPIPAGEFSTFGFVAVFNPGNTRGIYTITSQITSGSGGESSVKNNADSEKLDYFSE